MRNIYFICRRSHWYGASLSPFFLSLNTGRSAGIIDSCNEYATHSVIFLMHPVKKWTWTPIWGQWTTTVWRGRISLKSISIKLDAANRWPKFSFLLHISVLPLCIKHKETIIIITKNHMWHVTTKGTLGRPALVSDSQTL